MKYIDEFSFLVSEPDADFPDDLNGRICEFYFWHFFIILLLLLMLLKLLAAGYWQNHFYNGK
jgi:hypothetical protein